MASCFGSGGMLVCMYVCLYNMQTVLAFIISINQSMILECIMHHTRRSQEFHKRVSGLC